MPAFFVSSLDIRETQITLTGDLCHHVRASLRVKPGEDLWLTHEQRRRYRVRVTHVSQQAVMTEILEQRLGPVETGPPLLLAQALLKGDHMDWVVQKASELGVRTILPLVSRHGVVRPQPDRIAAQVARWQRIATEAAQQSEQWQPPRKCWNRWSHAASSPLTKRPARFSWQNATRLPHWPGYPCQVSPRNSSP